MRKGVIQALGILTAITSVVAVFILFLILNRSLPPVKEFRAYHSIMFSVLEEQGDNIDLEAYDTARLFFDRAYRDWQEENTRFMLLRDYSESKRLVLIAISLAEEVKDKQDARAMDLRSQDVSHEKTAGQIDKSP